ncbi:MAG: DUF3105 domain-containing protein [Thermoleophilia bacterium]|nr:DUF3105 domain-containing protein [Thermoleophilia bacterium]
MAKKPRTPPPPRRVQAPQARSRDAGREGRPLWLLIAVGAAVLAAAAAGVFLFAFGGSASAGESIRGAGCTLEIVPVEYPEDADGAPLRHVDELPEGFEYPTDPPVAGPHHNVQSPLDVYDEPVEQLRLVHNMEHGAVVIQYGEDVPEADVRRIVEWYRADPNGLLIAPLPRLGDQISLGAWRAHFGADNRLEREEGVLAKCPRFDEQAFDAFLDEYGFQGPEGATRDQLPPGGG